MVALTARVDSRAVRRGLRVLPKEIGSRYARAVTRQTLWTERAVKRGLSRGEVLRKEIRKTVTSRIAGQAMKRRGTVATNHRSAKMIEFGETIRPKRTGRTYVVSVSPDGTVKTKQSTGRFLAIPAKDVRTRAGRARGSHVDSAIQRSAGGPFYSWVQDGVIYWRRAGEKRVRVGGFLVGSVTVPARPVWRPVARRARKRLRRDVQRAVKDARRKAKL